MVTLRATVIASMLLATASIASAAVEYDALNLRLIATVPGFVATGTAGISDDGNYVTGRGSQSYLNGTGGTSVYTTAFRYQVSTGELLRLPEVAPGSNIGPNGGAGVNNSGLVAGGGTTSTGSGRGFLANATSIITIPRPEEAGPAGSTARGINNFGLVAGDQVNNNGSRPFVYSDKNNNFAYDAGESNVLPYLSGDGLGVVGGLNNLGQVTGYTANSVSGGASSTRRVVLWSPDGSGGYTAKNITDGTHGAPSRGQGVAINDKGSVAYYNSGDGGAYLYRDADGNGPLEAESVGIPGLYGLPNIFPTDVNNNNVVVGGNAGSAGGGINVRYAFVWDETNGIRDLNTLLPADFDYTLTTATGISDDGVISVTGTLKGGTSTAAFLLMPLPQVSPDCPIDLPPGSPSAVVPEPAIVAPLALAAVTLLRRRRRC